LGHPDHFYLPSHCNCSNLLLPGPMLYALVRMPAFKVKNEVGRRFAAKDLHRRVWGLAGVCLELQGHWAPTWGRSWVLHMLWSLFWLRHQGDPSLM
jgi:hypothetical protein